MGKETWERRIKDVIAKKELFTTGISNAKGEPVSTFDVLEIQPNRDNDQELYLIAGSENSVLEQTSLLIAISEMVSRKLGDVSLEGWINDFEYGFPYHGQDVRKKEEILLPWGRPPEQRPKLTKLPLVPGAVQVRDFIAYRLMPNRNEPDEFFILTGSPQQILLQAMQIMNSQRQLEQSNLGSWIGYPLDEYIRSRPQQIVSLKIILTTVKSPPFYKKGKAFYSQRQVSIPFVNAGKLSYNAIRAVCGGAAGQKWGEWTARAYISSPDLPGAITRMEADGSTEAQAIANLDKYLTLSNCIVHRRTQGKVDLTKGTTAKNPNNQYLNSFTVYPAWCYVQNPKLLAAEDLQHQGKQTTLGKKVAKQGKLFLWTEKPPSTFETHLKELLKSPLTKMVKP